MKKPSIHFVETRGNAPLPDENTIKQMISQGEAIYKVIYETFEGYVKEVSAKKPITEKDYNEIVYEFFKALPGFIDRFRPALYDTFIKPHFGIDVQTFIYSYVANGYGMPLIWKVAEDFKTKTNLEFKAEPKPEAPKPKTNDFGLSKPLAS
jgi:hypothetical protein